MPAPPSAEIAGPLDEVALEERRIAFLRDRLAGAQKALVDARAALAHAEDVASRRSHLRIDGFYLLGLVLGVPLACGMLALACSGGGW